MSGRDIGVGRSGARGLPVPAHVLLPVARPARHVHRLPEAQVGQTGTDELPVQPSAAPTGIHRVERHLRHAVTGKHQRQEAGQLALAYKVFRCWVSEYQALPDLDANANAVAIQTIKLENEGWERDYDVSEPAEPNFTEPA